MIFAQQPGTHTCKDQMPYLHHELLFCSAAGRGIDGFSSQWRAHSEDMAPQNGQMLAPILYVPQELFSRNSRQNLLVLIGKVKGTLESISGNSNHFQSYPVTY